MPIPGEAGAALRATLAAPPSGPLPGMAEYLRAIVPTNVIDAAATGASDGLKLAVNVAAMLLAFIALIAMLNGILTAIGSQIGFPQLTFEQST
jgi:CNT family concentrative nucleoside transporter